MGQSEIGTGRTRTAAGALAVCLAAALPVGAWASKPAAKKSSVEVVFVLDTTGSMGGLLEGAKKKIWSIANEIAKAKPTPDIKMGLIAYRDRGDAYVTKVVDLTSDLDKVYGELLTLAADGGGDGPEHVLKALEDAEKKISWEDDSGTFRVMYLVGDAPAHHDYGDTAELEKLTERLVRKGVVLNTIQCGSDPSTTMQWRRIAGLGEGKFLPIAHGGGVVAVTTPFDDKIAGLSVELERTMVGYGEKREEVRRLKARSERLTAMAPAAAAADRAEFKSARGFSAELDLVSGLEQGTVAPETVANNELPESFQGLSPAEIKVKAERISKDRKKIRTEILELSKKRGEYLKEREEKSGGDSFDRQLVESLKEQARRKGILYNRD